MNELKRFQTGRILPITFTVTFLGFLDTVLLIPFIALYASELGASLSITGLIIGLYSIANTPANVLFGQLIDRVGYKLPLIAGLIGDALSMFLYSLCRLPIHLALVRTLHGVTGASIGPATMSVIAASTGESQKGLKMGFYGISLATATLVGYGLSGTIASQLGYKAVFLFGAGMLAVGAMVGLLLPGDRRKSSSEAKTSFREVLEKAKELRGKKWLISTACRVGGMQHVKRTGSNTNWAKPFAWRFGDTQTMRTK